MRPSRSVAMYWPWSVVRPNKEDPLLTVDRSEKIRRPSPSAVLVSILFVQPSTQNKELEAKQEIKQDQDISSFYLSENLTHIPYLSHL